MKYFYFLIFFSFFSKFYGVDQDLTQQDLTKQDLREPCELAILDLPKILLIKKEEQENVYHFVNQLINFEDCSNYIKSNDYNNNQYASSLQEIKRLKDIFINSNQISNYNAGLKIEALIPPIETFVASVLNQIQESSKDDLEKIVFHLLHMVQSEKRNTDNTINDLKKQLLLEQSKQAELNQSKRNTDNTINDLKKQLLLEQSKQAELNQSKRNADNTINDLKKQLLLEQSKQAELNQSTKTAQDILKTRFQDAQKKINDIIKQAQKKKRKNRALEKKITEVQKNHADEVDQYNQQLTSLESQYQKLQEETLNIRRKHDHLNDLNQNLTQANQLLLNHTSQFCEIWKMFQNEMPYLMHKIETISVRFY